MEAASLSLRRASFPKREGNLYNSLFLMMSGSCSAHARTNPHTCTFTHMQEYKRTCTRTRKRSDERRVVTAFLVSRRFQRRSFADRVGGVRSTGAGRGLLLRGTGFRRPGVRRRIRILSQDIQRKGKTPHRKHRCLSLYMGRMTGGLGSGSVKL